MQEPKVTSETGTTRQRILEVALELFNSKGYDKTSLREIADRLGFTKAALYYHFRSKDDILLTLHYQFHDMIQGTLARLEEDPHSIETWATFLDEAIVELFAHHDLLMLHERNRSALVEAHSKGHEGGHQEVDEVFRAMLRDTDVPLVDRVRMVCALGAVIGGVVMGGEAFAGVAPAQVAALVREVVGAMLRPGRTDPDEPPAPATS